jgi:hypothetical protein
MMALRGSSLCSFDLIHTVGHNWSEHVTSNMSYLAIVNLHSSNLGEYIVSGKRELSECSLDNV